MNVKHFVFGILLCLVIQSCDQSNNKITNASDYKKFLELTNNDNFDSANEELTFWTKKLENAPAQYPYLSKIASANIQLFEITGNIENLREAEQKLVEVNSKTNYNKASLLRALARNYITQHKFKEALNLLQKAEENGENVDATQKMLFDVYLELGDYKLAEKYLSEFENLNSFDYLIRLSKWSDHKGNLNDAIKYMERACLIAEASKNEALIQWSYTNLADFYGHAGRIRDAYNHYLKALVLNPNDAYALKGIAWIVYSFERNPEESLVILNSIAKRHHSPDYFLLKAEIAEFMSDSAEKEKNLNAYFKAVKSENYGEMYNKYNSLLFAEELQKMDEALSIADREIKQRPTPQSYDLLAWAYYHKGETKKALEIMESNVINQSFEPEILYHFAVICKANGKDKEVKKLKKELLESAFELGPNMEQKIMML